MDHSWHCSSADPGTATIPNIANRLDCNELFYRNGFVGKKGSGGHGVYVLGNDNRISGNIINENARNGIRMEGEDNIFEGNVIYDNREFGITLWVDAPMKGEDLIIRKNLLLNNKRGGISLYGQGSGKSPERVYIYNNTIVHKNTEFGLRIINGPREVKVKNNIIMGRYRDAFIYIDEESLAGYEEDFNLFHGTGGFYFGGKIFGSINGYRASSRQGRHSLSENPHLQKEYVPGKGSPAIDRGTDVGIAFHGSAPDIGAFETGGIAESPTR